MFQSHCSIAGFLKKLSADFQYLSPNWMLWYWAMLDNSLLWCILIYLDFLMYCIKTSYWIEVSNDFKKSKCCQKFYLLTVWVESLSWTTANRCYCYHQDWQNLLFDRMLNARWWFHSWLFVHYWPVSLYPQKEIDFFILNLWAWG